MPRAALSTFWFGNYSGLLDFCSGGHYEVTAVCKKEGRIDPDLGLAGVFCTLLVLTLSFWMVRVHGLHFCNAEWQSAPLVDGHNAE